MPLTPPPSQAPPASSNPPSPSASPEPPASSNPPSPSASPEPPPNGQTKTVKTNRTLSGSEAQGLVQPKCQHCGEIHLAGNVDQQALVDALAEEGANNWDADMGPIVAQILAAANDSNDYETFLQRLNQMDPATNNLAKTLAIQAMKARGDGDLGNG